MISSKGRGGRKHSENVSPLEQGLRECNTGTKASGAPPLGCTSDSDGNASFAGEEMGEKGMMGRSDREEAPVATRR